MGNSHHAGIGPKGLTEHSKRWEREREIREREIIQLQRQIEAEATPGCFGGSVRLFGIVLAIVLSLFGVMVLDLWDVAKIVYPLMLIGYPILWMVERAAQNRRKARLKQLLKEDGQDINRATNSG